MTFRFVFGIFDGMPSRNRIKQYVAGDYYHIYNRGVEKRLVFMDEQDYGVFLAYLKLYLSEPGLFDKRHKDLSAEVELGAYCLMPNHYHLLVRQLSDRGIESLMRCLGTAYVMYFNHRYERVGSLFQDVYKAVRVIGDEQLYQVENYIHDNPRGLVEDVRFYPYSSLYRAGGVPSWLKPPAARGQSLYRDGP